MRRPCGLEWVFFLAEHSQRRVQEVFVQKDCHALMKHIARKVLGDRLEQDLTVEEVIAELRETFVPFFIIPTRARCEPRWRELLGEHVLCTNNPRDVCYVSAGAICLNEGLVPDLDALIPIFKGMGLEYGDLSSVVRALTPLAKSLGRAGSSA